jgi:hypothetical protein
MKRTALLLPLAVLTFLPGPSVLAQQAGKPANAEFDRTVALILTERCLDCHSGPRPKGGLDLSHRRTALVGGKSGVVLLPHKADESLLWQYIRDGKMPPKKPLANAEKAVLRTWIAAGAVWGSDPVDPFRVTSDKRAGYDWWALQPVRRPALPPVSNASWSANPIDTFVLHHLEAKGLLPSPPADRRRLIRRLFFDLIGLPPSPAEIAAFLKDDAPDSYGRLVDRLLASPQYGERWARHWLDVVRFGETNGFEFDEFRPNAWPYRDWVVAAFNQDLPYDEFVRLQLAGDVLRPKDPEAIKATGFLVAGAYDTVGQTQQSEAMRRVVRQDELEDVVGVVGQTFLGLTINCARCHDHKFDPVRQVEYYRLAAALSGVRHGERLLPFPPDTPIATRQQLLALAGRLTALGVVAGIKPTGDPLFALIRPVHAVTPRQPEVTHLLIRGETRQPAQVVRAGGVAALGRGSAEFGLSADAPESERRRQLALWITQPANPLFPRVLVNRLWHYHFGSGLVETPNDFGFNGARPSHPAMLDWLAAEFVEHGWSLKHLHRLIVSSATYRQASHGTGAALQADAGNRLLWRKSPLRLDAEALRDAMLSATGRLNLQMGGPGFQDFRRTVAPGTLAELYTPTDPTEPACNRRTLYRTWARAGRNPLLDAFDCPDPSATAPRRAVTTTPLQALAMLNNSFVLRMADAFAERLKRDAGPDVEQQIRLAYLVAYGRLPREEEELLARHVIAEHGLATLTRAIFNSNEFLYID